MFGAAASECRTLIRGVIVHGLPRQVCNIANPILKAGDGITEARAGRQIGAEGNLLPAELLALDRSHLRVHPFQLGPGSANPHRGVHDAAAARAPDGQNRCGQCKNAYEFHAYLTVGFGVGKTTVTWVPVPSMLSRAIVPRIRETS